MVDIAARAVNCHNCDDVHLISLRHGTGHKPSAKKCTIHIAREKQNDVKIMAEETFSPTKE